MHRVDSRPALAMFVVLGALLACNVFTPERGAIELTIDRTGLSGPTVFTLRNVSGTRVFVPRCGDRITPELERLKDGQWVNAAAAICPAIRAMDPFSLEPATARRDSLLITEAGRYRFRINVSEGDPRSGSVLVLSPAFTVD